MTQPLAASARPDIISLDVLLSDVDEGRVRIPRFQRPYVWTPQMMRELFESVLSGYPIGSLLIWAPRDVVVETMDGIGPIRTPTMSGSYPASLVLDGHQRLATLYGVLRLPEDYPRNIMAGADTLNWWIGYDLETQQPRQMRRPEDFDDETLLPLRAVLRTADFVRFARTIDASAKLTAQQKAIYLDRADQVQRAIRDYRIALTNMRDGTVDDAVAIFSRINRSGRRMTTDQMAVALTYRDGFNLEVTLDRMLGALEPFGFGDVSRKVILQSLLFGASRNFTKPNFDDLRVESTRMAIEAAEKPMTDALRVSAKFLNQSIGFRTGRLLPYALQLLLLSVYFSANAQNARDGLAGDTKALQKWFWATSFEGWFAAANSADVEKAVRAMQGFAAAFGEDRAMKEFEKVFIDRPLRPFPKTFDRRSARIRALLLVQIVAGELMDPMTGEAVDGSALMADPDRRDLPYVFAPDGSDGARSPANRIILPRTHGSIVRTALAQHIEEVAALESYAIDQKARLALLDRDLSRFVQAREAVLRRMEERFLSQFDLHIHTGVTRADDEIDIDEDA